MMDALPMLTGERAMELWTKANPGLQQFPPSLYLRDFAHATVQEYASHFAQREREAERAALYNFRHDRMSFADCKGTTEWIDKMYPSLAPQPSREITLSSGETYRRNKGVWEYLWAEQGKWVSMPPSPPLTAADHDKCAAILREEEL